MEQQQPARRDRRGRRTDSLGSPESRGNIAWAAQAEAYRIPEAIDRTSAGAK